MGSQIVRIAVRMAGECRSLCVSVVIGNRYDPIDVYLGDGEGSGVFRTVEFIDGSTSAAIREGAVIMDLFGHGVSSVIGIRANSYIRILESGTVHPDLPKTLVRVGGG